MSLGAWLTPVLVPPVNLAVLAAAGTVLGRRAGRLLAGACLLALLLLAVPVLAEQLLRSLEIGLPAGSPVPPAAIVVLGGDLQWDPATPLGADPGLLTLERLRAGAALARRTHLPLLVTGGTVLRGAAPVAEVMAASLRQDFGLPPRWVEARSATTWENAQDSAPMLESAGIRSAFVVSQAWHLRRAAIAFAQTGLAVSLSPTQLDGTPTWRPDEFVPSVRAWQNSYYALHEWIGCFWYRLRAWRGHG